MSRLLPLIALLLTSAPAWAKSPKKMTDAELMEAVQHDKSSSNREKAADELGERRVAAAAAVLGAQCLPGGDPSVCDHALWALEKLLTPEAKLEIARVLVNEQVPEGKRKVAMRVLGRVDREMLGQVAVQVLTAYRRLDGDFIKPLVDALVEGGNTAAADLTILIATDLGTPRMGRVAALDAAEAFQHPRLADAWVALLTDEDKKIRLRCAQALGRSGLPPQQVVPPLMHVARNDDKGDVRAAAFASLKRYASAELLPLLNYAVLNETHIAAYGHAIQMFSVLADASSVPAIRQLLANGNLLDETAIEVIHAAVRIGDTSVILPLQTLADTTQSDQVRVEALEAIRILQGPVDQRLVVTNGWGFGDVVLVDMNVAVPAPPPLAVQVDAGGVVQWNVAMPGLSVDVTVRE